MLASNEHELETKWNNSLEDFDLDFGLD